MKYWWSTVVRDYLTFTKRERTGLLIFLFLAALLIFVVPRFFTSRPQTIDKQALISEQFSQLCLQSAFRQKIIL